MERRTRIYSRLTITKNAVQLVFRQESQPINTILLVFTQFCIDFDRYSILLDLRTVKQLTEELSLCLTTFEKVFGKARRVR